MIVFSERKGRVIKLEYVLEGEVVGRAYLVLVQNELHPEPYALLEDVFVKEEYRGRGIGKEIVRKAIEKARELGCYKIIATSRFEREKVHRFYESLGFKKWGFEFRIDFKE